MSHTKLPHRPTFPTVNFSDFSRFHPVGVRTSYTNNTPSKLCLPNLPVLTSGLTASDSVTVSQPNSTVALQSSDIHEEVDNSGEFKLLLNHQKTQIDIFPEKNN